MKNRLTTDTSAAYDLELARRELRYFTDLYGYTPFWAPGYRYPRYPYK